METNDIIIAAKNRAMNTYTLEDAHETIRVSIDKAYKLAEVPLPTGPDYQQLVESVTDKILRSYPYITSQEVALVAEAGVAGELGGRTKPNAAAFFGWLATYMNSDVRREAIRNYRRNNDGDPAARLLTPAETAELNRQAEVRGINALWNEYKQHGRILETEHLRGYVAMVCDGLVERKVFDIRPEHWELARKKADENRHRLMRSTIFDRALGYNAEMLAKWCMLEMCFGALVKSGRELEISA